MEQIFELEIHALRQQGMGASLHWYTEDVQVSKLAATLAGMANSSGGAILVGITHRSGQILGVNDVSGVIDRVFQATLLLDPPLVIPIPQTREMAERKVVLISVPAGLPYVYSFEGRFLGREGHQNNPLPARRLRQLLLERGVVQFEAQCPPDAALADVDDILVSRYIQALGLPGRSSNEETLLRRGCLKVIEGEYRPTYAALLLFGRYPQRWLSNATILAACFWGKTFSDQFLKQDIRGALPEQLQQVEAFFRANIRNRVRLVGLTHEETPEYPFEAVRELLVNAVAHRDYNAQGDNIHLNIFSDRIEVTSPGGLPGPVTLRNLLVARFSRNPAIVQVLSDLGYVERLGYGLDRVVSVLKQSGLPSPLFEEVAGSFRVTLFGTPEPKGLSPDSAAYRELDLNPRQQAALDYLTSHRRINSRDLQDLCPEVHPETLRRDLADLVGRGLLIKIGDKRATYYILK